MPPQNNRIRRNYKGLKVTTCALSLRKLWTRRYKKAKTQLPFLRSKEQSQGPVQDPSTQDHQRGSVYRHLSYPCGSACQSAPLHSPHMRNSLLTPLLSQRASKDTCCLFLLLLVQYHESLAWISPLASYQSLWIRVQARAPCSLQSTPTSLPFLKRMIATVLTSSNIDEFCLPFTLCEWN